MVKDDLRRIKTRENISKHFIQMLASRSFNDITIKELVAECRINKTTFYRNFNDKYDLLDSIIKYLSVRFQQSLSPDILNMIISKDEQDTAKYLGPLLDYFEEYRQTLLILQKCDLAHCLFDSMENTLRDLLLANAKKQFPQSNSVTALYCGLIASNILTTIKWWHITDNQLSREEIIRTIHTTIHLGIIQSFIDSLH